MAPPADPATPAIPPFAAWIGVALLVAFSSAVRIQLGLGDPHFDREQPEGLLKSDPALLYYITERIVESNGAAPEDFRADPRVQHPARTDLPAEFTVGQEFLIAWAYRLLGSDAPLHVFCVWAMAITASLMVAGVYLLAASRAGPLWGLAAAALFVVLPASYRTVGFILVREDLSLPLFALHLGFAACGFADAARRRAGPWLLASGLALALALATWHAMRFVFALEAAVVFAWFLRSGQNPLASRRGWLLLVPSVLACGFVPALRFGGALFSPGMQLALALAAAGLLASRPGARPRTIGLVALTLFAAAGLVLGGSGFHHVRDVLFAKLAHFGRFPSDPAELSFDARLLWQGPFETLALSAAWRAHAWVLLPALAAAALWLPAWVRGKDPAPALCSAGFVAALSVAWLFERLVVVPALLAPALAVFLASGLRDRRLAAAGLAVVLALQAAGTVRHTGGLNPWYVPAGRQTEIAALVRWVADHVEPTEAIVGDFVNSTAILAHAGNPIVLQPKYETDHSRRRAQAFLETFFHESPEALRGLVRDRFQARYLLVDRYTLWELSRVTAGLRADERAPRAGTAAEVFLSQEPSVLESVPGFELVYRSPEDIRRPGGEPYDFFRLYRVD